MNSEKGQNEPEIGGAPMDITSFSFHCTTSYADGCYRLTLERTEEGVLLHGEDLFLGGRMAEAMIEEDILNRLGELAGYYCIDRWDGFDKNKKNVSDGSAFTLNMTLADGVAVSAHGSNVFPDYYAEVSSQIREIYDELMEQYATAQQHG